MMALQISELLKFMVDTGGSDLHLSVGREPTVRMSGRLRSLNKRKLTSEDTVAFVKSIASERNQRELEESGSSDFGFQFGDSSRFRVSIFRQKGHMSLVLRQIPNRFLTFEEIGLPQLLKNHIQKPRGLILVTGPTGSGKTTTLATMVNFINETKDRHIITIEDPIEYYFHHEKSVVTQREIGVDVPDFPEAIRRALRQDPDVILVGEMRDLETIQAAITAAETGHLVMGTLHTTGASRTINRIIDAFPTNQQEQVRAQLSTSIEAVISQALMPRSNKKGVVAAFEVLIMSPSIANLIRDNKVHQLNSEIQTGGNAGMILLDDSLFHLYATGQIEFSEAIQRAQNQKEFEEKVKARQAAGIED
ncbi:MAG: type IV pilus twitching motility protein PilT [Planctomycetota bacterium]|nr:type IV pilus twitching motility protein PilT [Planctomycetota bacterium]MDP7251204.1 type IV pilus twitching motility protein PilT [Planctomycetota bacterium]